MVKKRLKGEEVSRGGEKRKRKVRREKGNWKRESSPLLAPYDVLSAAGLL